MATATKHNPADTEPVLTIRGGKKMAKSNKAGGSQNKNRSKAQGKGTQQGKGSGGGKGQQSQRAKNNPYSVSGVFKTAGGLGLAAGAAYAGNRVVNFGLTFIPTGGRPFTRFAVKGGIALGIEFLQPFGKKYSTPIALIAATTAIAALADPVVDSAIGQIGSGDGEAAQLSGGGDDWMNAPAEDVRRQAPVF